MPTTKTRTRSPGVPSHATEVHTKRQARRRARPSLPGRAGPVNEWLELRRSPIHGLGGFARRDIPKGTRIVEYTGEKISNAEADRRYDDEAMKRHHTFLFVLNSRTCVDAAFEGNEARFLNHSCAPNCEAVIERGRIWIDALTDIPAGSELLYDYQYEDDPEYTQDDLRFYACHCGAPNCRGTIVKTRRKVRPAAAP
ncbi:MAG TPA: SET domain-containing protein-lysine N-methyltransferase [Gemmatimonadaceae bacterium]|nr:SET domain-containing protein-lysine N-methyltransferase [Gemmatimonadaceae bacterium]